MKVMVVFALFSFLGGVIIFCSVVCFVFHSRSGNVEDTYLGLQHVSTMCM